MAPSVVHIIVPIVVMPSAQDPVVHEEPLPNGDVESDPANSLTLGELADPPPAEIETLSPCEDDGSSQTHGGKSLRCCTAKACESHKKA